MLTNLRIGDKVFQWLVEIDEETSLRVAAAGCPWCGGRLHRGDYPRKPRGGLVAVAGEVFSRRISLCCGRPGCRRRATPPSVRFLGRRVYLGVAVLLAGVLNCTMAAPQVKRATGIPSRTVKRWGAWWQADFPRSRVFQEQRGRFLPPPCLTALPASLWERLEYAGRQEAEVLVRTLCFLSPLTTGSVVAQSRLMRVASVHAEEGSTV